MGKPFPSAIQPKDFAAIISKQIGGPKSLRPRSKNHFFPESLKLGGGELDRRVRKMDESERKRLPLSAVVSDCVNRWFQDTLKDAQSGDISMQVLVGQMYYTGYGIPKDEKKGKAWISKASRNRSSVWKVSNKHPGYNASDSDSDEVTGDLK